MTMDLSILIVNWNTREHLRKCLRSIYGCPPEGEFEVIVVDNASSDGSAQMVRDDFPSVRLLANSDNRCYAEGNNQAAEMASGRYLLLLNPDTEMKENTLTILYRFARSHPDAGAVTCRLIGTDGRVQSSCRSFPEPEGVLYEYARLSRLFPRSRRFGAYRMTYFDYATECEVDQPMASCLLIPRKAWEDVGLFDTGFPIFFNEVDWLYRAKSRGWHVYFTPETELIHFGGASTGQVKPEMVRESHKSLRRFYDKHYRGRIWPPIYWLIVLAMAANSYFASRLRAVGQQRRD